MDSHYMIQKKWFAIATESIAVPLGFVPIALRIYVDRPHVVNRRLAGIEEMTAFSSAEEISEIATDKEVSWLSELTDYLRCSEDILSPSKNPGSWTVEVRELIPRSHDYFSCLEAVITDNDSQHVTFLPLSVPRSVKTSDPPEENGSCPVDLDVKFDDNRRPVVFGSRNPTTTYAYRISWESDLTSPATLRTIMRLSILQPVSCVSAAIQLEPSVVWLRTQLLPKLVSWTEKVKPDDVISAPSKASLRLVSVKRYTETLIRLKATYGRELLQNWTESTDPQKFVSEDLCIAAYLLTLWQVDRSSADCRMPSFVDLGCGNGLLVYILSSEGCPGTGIDVRERRIWKQFKTHANLVERTLDPSTETFADFDWIIGNHSDELTPWIPYIAAMSSYKCNFFLLPCCAFDFNHKFIKPGNEGEYSSYFKYIRKICKIFGFATEEDALRIPSTKRSCFIGRGREYPAEDQPTRTTINRQFMQSRLRQDGSSFVVRPPGNELPKNCTALPATVKENIIVKLTTKLLENGRLIALPHKRWNAGQKIPLNALVGALDSPTLLSLKSQCGGLQTFVRNHKYIFSADDAEVELRNYAQPKVFRAVSKKKSKIPVDLKSKSCWFNEFHPDGCPVLELDCDYSHSVRSH